MDRNSIHDRNFVRDSILGDRALVQAIARYPRPANVFPNSDQLRSPLMQRAVVLRNSISAATSGRRFVSLMVDIMRWAGRVWLGICLDTARQWHFWRLVHEVDQKASTKANTLADMVLDLRMHRLIVCSIVTDNASNECATLNPELATSVQRATGINVFRTSCLSHTGNLAVGDFLTVLGTKHRTACDVRRDSFGLRDGLTNWSWTSELHGLPGLCRAR
jgi:hypothetical protein